MLNQFVLDFIYAVPFRDEGDSRATGVEYQDQISDSFAPAKLGE